MKLRFVLIIALLFVTISFAQQQGINYKALIKDANGNVLADTSIRIHFSIRDNPSDQYITYSEEHLVDTDANGMVVVNIGTGTQTSEDDPFSELEWSTTGYYLNVELDITGGTNYVNMGTTQFMAAPYAKHANTATIATTALNAGAININGLSDGKSDANGSSIFLGVGAGASDDGTPNANMGIGYRALFSNTTGYFNVASGSEALYFNTEGRYNTGNGFWALRSNTTGEFNTANGALTLYLNTTGHSNTANGFQALNSNTTGFENTANGYQALFSNTTGNGNTANGRTALYNNTTGYYNTANGVLALGSNTTGSGNVALGYNAGYNETGSNKLYIANSNTSTPLIYGEFDTKKLILNGETIVSDNSDFSFIHALKGIKTHTGNSDSYGVFGQNTVSDSFGTGVHGSGGWIGVSGSVNPSGSNDYYGVSGSVFGGTGTNYGVYGSASGGATSYAMYAQGNMNVTGTFTNPSDRKLKTNIQPLQQALVTISQLKASTYTIKPEYVKKMSMSTTQQYGFVAQEIQEVLPGLVSVNKHPGEKKEDPSIEYLGINYMALIPILTKAIQEQQEEIEVLKTENQNKDTVLAKQNNVLVEVLKRLNTIENTTATSRKEKIYIVVND